MRHETHDAYRRDAVNPSKTFIQTHIYEYRYIEIRRKYED